MKCTIDSELGLLGIHPDTDENHLFFCVDIATKNIVFQNPAKGRYTHHWITINDQKYLSLQTNLNTISMFRVSDDHQFEEEESMKITLNDDDKINFCEYDQSFDHLLIVKNDSILEKRAVMDSGTVSMSIELENRIGNSCSKLMALSNDGKFCVIGAAGNTQSGSSASNFFYLVSLETQEQFKLTCNKLSNTYAPSFINVESEFIAIGGTRGEGVEIWSVKDKKMVHHIDDCRHDRSFVCCSYLHLYEMATWTSIYRHQFGLTPRSLFLTSDNKYLAASGNSGDGREKAVILQIQ